jgi:hypothetical protein
MARLDMLNAMDEESKDNLKKEECVQYSRRNKALQDPQGNDSQSPPCKWARYPFPLNTIPTPPSKYLKNDDIQSNF